VTSRAPQSTTVLVTGASGFIGRHALRALLDRGFTVHGVSRRPPTTPPCPWHALDLFDPVAVARLLDALRPTHLLHLAWETSHGTYWTSADNLKWVGATLILVRAFRDAGGSRAVAAGTCAEYLWQQDSLDAAPLDEWTAPRQGHQLYGVAKNATAEVLAAYAATSSLSLAWGRLFFPYGPGDHRPTLVPAVIAALRERRPALCSHGRQQRDFIHVRDAAGALAALLASPVEGPVNIATGAGTPIAEVVNALGALLGRPDLIRLGALPARPGEPARLVASVRRLREEVGYTTFTPLDTGLKETVAWWLEQPLDASRPSSPEEADHSAG
jgi:nucleoside-diphosphate-sugar epimerase